MAKVNYLLNILKKFLNQKVSKVTLLIIIVNETTKRIISLKFWRNS